MTGNEAGDFDSTAGAIAYAYVMDAIDSESNWIPLLNLPSSELCGLRGEIDFILSDLGIVYEDFIMASDAIEFAISTTENAVSFTLFDHNEPSGYWGDRWGLDTIGQLSLYSLIDHHKDSRSPLTMSCSPRIIEESGSATSLLVNWLKPLVLRNFQALKRFEEVSKCVLGAILIDTDGMKNKVTSKDLEAMSFLTSIGKKTSKQDLKALLKEIKGYKSRKPEDAFASSLILRKDLKSFKTVRDDGSVCRWAMSTVHIPMMPPSMAKPVFLEEIKQEADNWDYFIVISIFKNSYVSFNGIGVAAVAVALDVDVAGDKSNNESNDDTNNDSNDGIDNETEEIAKEEVNHLEAKDKGIGKKDKKKDKKGKKKKKKQLFIKGAGSADLTRHLTGPCGLEGEVTLAGTGQEGLVQNQRNTSLSRKDIQPLVEDWIRRSSSQFG